MSLQQQTRPAYPNKRNAMSPTAAGSSATYPQGGWTAGPSYYHNQNAAAAGAQRYAQPSNVQAYGSYRQPSVSALFGLKDSLFRVAQFKRPCVLCNQKIIENNQNLRPGCPPDYQIFL